MVPQTILTNLRDESDASKKQLQIITEDDFFDLVDRSERLSILSIMPNKSEGSGVIIFIGMNF